jgi:hypothetical protein
MAGNFSRDALDAIEFSRKNGIQILELTPFQRASSGPIDTLGIRVASAMMENGTDVSFADLRKMMGDLVVRDALVAAAPAGSLETIRIRAEGYGEVAPLVCNDTDPGRAINRRVEVWISDLVGGER